MIDMVHLTILPQRNIQLATSLGRRPTARKANAPGNACERLSRPGSFVTPGFVVVRKVDHIALLEHGCDLLGPDGGDTMLPRIGTNSSLSSI
jgi:hypothetical protein